MKRTFHGGRKGPQPVHAKLSRRERQIMDALYALEEASASDVVSHIREPDAYDSVRVTLGILEKKGYVAHRAEGNRNVYFPVVPAAEAQSSAMQHLVQTFFGGSTSRALLAFLDEARDDLSEAELARIARIIEQRARDEDKEGEE